MSKAQRIRRSAWVALRGLALWLLISLIFWAFAAVLPGIDVPSFGAVLLTTGLIAPRCRVAASSSPRSHRR
jgi:hypothetical protein